MRRCLLCEKRIWPWQRRGWFFSDLWPYNRVDFHARCKDHE